jgi:hypothetical protein
MNFKHEANQEIRQQLIDNNPRGPKHGLNYSMTSTDAQRIARMITPMMKEGTSTLETALIGEVVASILKKPGESLQGVVNRLNIEFTNRPNAAIQAAQTKGMTVQGAHWTEGLGEDIKRLIYISKHGDPSTFAHEPAHIAAKNFTKEERAKAAKALDGYTISKGQFAGTTVYFSDLNKEWTDEQHEAFTDAFENFLTNGTVPNEEIRPLFEKIKEFMKRIYQTLTGWTEMSPELQNFMKEFVTGEMRENAQKEAPERTRKPRREAKNKKTINDTERTGDAAEALQDTPAAVSPNATPDHIQEQMRERREAIIGNPNLPLEEKAQAVFEAAEDALYQIGKATQAELDAVFNQYHNKDGSPKAGWLKAPNGKDTNLTENQWLAVRTPSFKKWFGEWETIANAEWVFNASPVKQMAGSEFAKSEIDLVTQVEEFFNSIGGKVEREGLGEVDLTRRGAKDSIGHGLRREKAIAFMAVPDVIKHGKIIDHQVNWKGRGYDTYVIDAPVYIGNTEYIAEVIIEQNKSNKNEFYLHEVEIKEKAQGAFKTATERGAPQASQLIIGKKLNDVKGNVSKIVDENGEPRTVYRGDKAGKDRFTNRQSVFHASDKEVAEKYASGETYELFLNVRKPLTLDEKSFIETREQINDMMYDFMEMDESELKNNTQFQTLLANYLAFRNEEGSSVRDFYNSFLPEVSDETGLEELRDIMLKSLHDANTFEWRQIDYKDIDILNPYIQTLGYDGIVRPYDPLGQAQGNEYITFEPTQIKSATDNIGTFDPDNPSILFQTAYHGSPFMSNLNHAGEYEHGWGHSFYSRIESAEWVKNAMEKASPIVAQLHVANIPEDQKLLHWDKTISEQPEAVREVLSKIITWDSNGKSEFNRAYNLREFNDGSFGFYSSIDGKAKWETAEAAQTAAKEEIKKTLTGEQLYKTIASKIGKKDTSLLLSHLGIKGTKYFDHSTGKIGVTKGHNYVIYDDSAVQLIPQISAPLFQAYDLLGETQTEEIADTETDNFKNWFEDSKVVDENGKPLVVFHGTARPDRVGEKFDPKRATSGPMAFFTTGREVAESYAKGKADTSLAYDDLDPYSYENWFMAKTGRGKPAPLSNAWHRLPWEQQEKIRKLAPRVTEEEGKIYLADEGHTNGIGNYDYEIKERRGNVAATLVEGWLNSGTLFNDEARFMEVLKLAGFDTTNISYHNPHATNSAVFPVYLKISNPLDTSDINNDTLAALKEASKTARQKRTEDTDGWDKNSVSPKEWMERLEKDNREKTAFTWTSIPDWVTKTLKTLGYDGIKDTGGKYSGLDHMVWIPFASTQIKSIYNRGTFGTKNTNILFQTDMQKMVEEAKTFEDGKDYRGFIEATGEMPDIIDPWWTDGQIDAWFEEFVKQAKKANNSISLDGIDGPALDTYTTADIDAEFLNIMEQDGKLEEFVQAIAGITQENPYNGQDDGLNDLRGKLKTEFADQGWQTAITSKGRMGNQQRARLMTLIRKAPRDYRAVYAEVMDREDLRVSHEDTTAEALKGRLDQEDIRREEVERLTPEKRRQLSAELDYEAYAKKIDNGTAQFDDPMHKEHLRRLNEKIAKAEETLKEFEADTNENYEYIERLAGKEFKEAFESALKAREEVTLKNEKLDRAIKAGQKDAARITWQLQLARANYNDIVSTLEALAREHKLELDVQAALSDERIIAAAKAAKVETREIWEGKFNALQKEYQDFRKSAKGEALLARLIHESELKALKTQVHEMYAQREAAKEVTKAKRGVVKRIFRRTNPADVNAEQGIAMAIIQNFAEPSFMKGVNDFINEIVEHDLRPVFEQWKVDERLRKSLYQGKHPATARKMRQLFSKEYDQLTPEEKRYLARKIAPEDWVQELGLEKIAERRRERYPLTEEQKQLVEKYLPKDVYYRIMDKPFSQWTLAEAEQLAKIMDDLTVQGKNMYKAHLAAEKKRIQAMRDAALNEIRRVKRKTWTGRERTDEEMEKILGKYYVSKDGTLQSDSERKKVGSIVNFHLINMYRFSRLLDNDQTGGINQTLLFRAGEDAYNMKMRAVDARAKIVFDKLEKLGFKDRQIHDLWKVAATIDHGGQLGTRQYTAWDLLGFTLAEKNNYAREALMYGNMLDERERSEFQRPGVIPEMMAELQLIAGDRFANVQAAAQNLIAENPSYQKIIDAISEDFKASASRINQALINYNNTTMETLDNYFPMDRVMPVGHKANDSIEKREIMGSAGGAFNLYVEKGFSHSRIDIPIQYQTAIKLDLMTVWADAVEKQEHFIAYAKTVKDLNKIYKQDRRLRQSIEGRWGKEALSFIDNYIDTLVNPSQEKTKNALDKVLKGLNFRGKTSSAYLGWKLSGIWLQAVTSPATFGTYMKPHEYWSGFFSYMVDGVMSGKQWQEICDISPHMKHRNVNMMTALIKDMAKDKTASKAGQKLNQFNEIGVKGLTWIDNICVVAGWKGLFQKEYTRLSKEGILSAEEIRVKAGQYADDIVGAIQPDSRPEHYAPMYRDTGYLGKSLIQFTQSLNVQFQTLYDIPYFVRTRQINKAVGLVSSFAIAGLVLGWSMVGFDDDDDEEEKLKKVLYWTTQQFTESVPLLGSLASSLTEKAITGDGRVSLTGERLFPQLNSIEKGLSSLANKNIARAVASFVEAFMLSTGLPVSGYKEAKKVFMDGEGGTHFNPGAVLRREKGAKFW